jgi:hypothetical protein
MLLGAPSKFLIIWSDQVGFNNRPSWLAVIFCAEDLIQQTHLVFR